MELLQFLQGEIQQRLVLVQAVRHQLTDHLVRVPEGHALLYQVVRAVRRVGEPARGAALHHVPAEGHGLQHRGEHRQALHQRIARVEEGFLVLLHVLVVCQREALHHRQQAHQVPVDPPGLPADQLRHVRILLLRHDA